MNIVILDADTIGSQEDLAVFEQYGSVRIFDKTAHDERVKNIADAEIVITNKVILDEQVFKSCPTVRLICITATGTNNVDFDAAEKYNVTVKNAKAYSTESVAQHTFSCLLHLNSRLHYYSNYTSSGQYSNQPLFTHLGPSISNLRGKTFGIIGLGAIGRRVAQLATAFGCKVIYYSTSGNNNTPDYMRLPLEQLLLESDFISIHAPLNDQTEDLLTLVQFEQMKTSAILLNMGRGGIVNEDDLALALQSNMIDSACLDVMKQEPLQEDSPLLPLAKSGRLLLTPHIAWASVEARKRLLEITVQNIVHYLK